MTTVAQEWRKPSASSNQTNCVEVHRHLGAVRDSKHAEGGQLAVDVAALASAVRRGAVGRN